MNIKNQGYDLDHYLSLKSSGIQSLSLLNSTSLHISYLAPPLYFPDCYYGLYTYHLSPGLWVQFISLSKAPTFPIDLEISITHDIH